MAEPTSQQLRELVDYGSYSHDKEFEYVRSRHLSNEDWHEDREVIVREVTTGTLYRAIYEVGLTPNNWDRAYIFTYVHEVEPVEVTVTEYKPKEKRK